MPTQANSSKKKSRLKEIPHYEKDPRWPRFVKLLLQYQNARKAALDAGYSKSHADVGSSRMAAKVLDGLQGALWRRGMHVDRMADKLVKLFDAQEPKWNAAEKKWDYFENSGTQISAYDRIKAILEPAPPEKLEVDVLVGVRRDDKRQVETPEDWAARNQSRRGGTQERSQALISGGMATPVQREEARGATKEKMVSKTNSRPGNGKGNCSGNGGGNL